MPTLKDSIRDVTFVLRPFYFFMVQTGRIGTFQGIIEGGVLFVRGAIKVFVLKGTTVLRRI